MRIKLFDKNCLPTKGYIDDAGFDLRSAHEVFIMPRATVKIHCGVAVEIPRGYSGDIRPRSSTSMRGILVHYGTVDVGYTGEISVVVTNLNDYQITIGQYERIAQIVINKTCDDNSLEVVDELDKSARGENGFGSTGL